MVSDEQAVEILLKDLQKIEDELLRRIKIALESGRLSSKDLAELSGQLDFFTELQKLGYTSKLEAHFGKYEEIIKQIQKQAAEQGVSGLVGTNVRDLDNIVNLQAKELLGKARTYADTLKTNLLSHIVAGTPIKGIIESMKETKLADYQLRVSLTTGLRQFRILSTSELYKDEPDKRFKLYGARDEKNRPACAGVLEYQPEEGFTRKEIDDGAWTKLAVKGIKEFGLNKDGELPPHLQKLAETIEYNFLTCGGFNCRHEPLAISE